jgi:hypothetical protein
MKLTDFRRKGHFLLGESECTCTVGDPELQKQCAGYVFSLTHGWCRYTSPSINLCTHPSFPCDRGEEEG